MPSVVWRDAQNCTRTMDISFKQYTEVKFCDAALRNAVRLDCAELVQRAIAKGGDVNCRYAEDWNTPLHLAIIYQCQSSVINELMNHTLDYGLVNGDNFTACELALRNDLRDLGRAMIVKEFECVEDPVDAIYEMLKRNSVEALEVLIEVLGLSGYSLAECLSKAWNKIEIMNVMMNPEVKVFVHMTLISLDYSLSIGSKQEGSSQNLQAEAQDQINLLITEISLIEQKYDTGLCHDITDEFLEVLRLILKHMFVVKNKVDKFPAMQLEYCIAMYLAIFDRKPDLDLYQLLLCRNARSSTSHTSIGRNTEVNEAFAEHFEQFEINFGICFARRVTEMDQQTSAIFLA
ncbi:AAEL002353-PA [Aedes aegypti]|uniref:AAEL002353-PA n=1 Tax=Aedes aegypti TaxID=7159 RepID=Q17IG7_AEDAE|nr:AAEL002353-PA [Aedes aegypti]